MIPLVLDQGLPRRAAEELRGRGWDVVHVGELAMHRAADEAILELARSRSAAVVSYDGDFGGVLAAERARGPSVILIRRQRVDGAAAVELLPQVVGEHLDAIRAGCIVSVTEGGSRVRLLPIGGEPDGVPPAPTA